MLTRLGAAVRTVAEVSPWTNVYGPPAIILEP